MAPDEHESSTSPPPEGDLPAGPTDPASADDPAVPGAASQPREDQASWLGCLWLVIVPGIVLTAVVIALNWLGC